MDHARITLGVMPPNLLDEHGLAKLHGKLWGTNMTLLPALQNDTDPAPERTANPLTPQGLRFGSIDREKLGMAAYCRLANCSGLACFSRCAHLPAIIVTPSKGSKMTQYASRPLHGSGRKYLPGA